MLDLITLISQRQAVDFNKQRLYILLLYYQINLFFYIRKCHTILASNYCSFSLQGTHSKILVLAS